MAADDPARPASPDAADALFEIPSGWDGAASDTAARHPLNEHYLVNEFSTFEAMARVWDAIVARAEAAGRPQIVSLLCHTYTMADAPFRERLTAILDYMRATAGAPVTATEAKALYDAGGADTP